MNRLVWLFKFILIQYFLRGVICKTNDCASAECGQRNSATDLWTRAFNLLLLNKALLFGLETNKDCSLKDSASLHRELQNIFRCRATRSSYYFECCVNHETTAKLPFEGQSLNRSQLSRVNNPNLQPKT